MMRGIRNGIRATLLLFVAALLASCGSNDTYSPTFGGTGGGGGTGEPSLSVQVSPATVTVNAGQSATYTVTVKGSGGCTGPVTLAAAGLPAGATATFNPASVSATEQGVTSTLTVTTTAGTGSLTGDIRSPRSPRAALARAAGQSRSRQEGGNGNTITVTGTGCNLTRTGTAQLVVQAANAPSFTVAVTGGNSKTVQAGQAASYGFTLTSVNGFAGTVTLSMTGLPNGATAAFAPTSVNLAANGTANGTVSVQTSTSTPAAASTLSLVGASGTLNNQAAATLIVTAPAGFTPSQLVYAQSLGPVGQRYITQLGINAQGRLTLLNPAAVPNSDNGTQVAVSPNQRFVYINRNHDQVIGQYSVTQSGTLQALSPATFALPVALSNGSGPIVADPRGRALYATSTSNNLLVQAKINANGTLAAFAPQTVAVGADGANYGMAVDKNGNNLYVVHANGHGGNDIVRFAIQADGSLAAGSTTTVATNPVFQIELSPNGQFAYAQEFSFNSNIVHQYRVGSNGNLTPLTPASVSISPIAVNGGNNLPGELSLDPTGHFVYYGDYGGGLARQAINADGTLGSFVVDAVTSTAPLGRPAFDPAGVYGFTTVGGSGAASGSVPMQFHIGADGSLSQFQTVDFGAGPPEDFLTQQGFVNRG
jgi:6-phosphogluconolactonase (cycloisomerase 2 family)